MCKEAWHTPALAASAPKKHGLAHQILRLSISSGKEGLGQTVPLTTLSQDLAAGLVNKNSAGSMFPHPDDCCAAPPPPQNLMPYRVQAHNRLSFSFGQPA